MKTPSFRFAAGKVRSAALLLLVWLLAAVGPAGAAAITVEADSRLNPEVVDATNRTVEAAQAFFAREYGLELDHDVRVILAGDKNDFVEALVHDGKASPVAADEKAEYALGVSGRSTIIERPGRQAKPDEVAFLLCHELTHQYQVQVAKGRFAAVHWLSEGVADYLAARLVADMGLGRLDGFRRRWEKTVAASPDRPRLAGLHGWEDWHAARKRFGAGLIYRMSGLAVLELVDRKGSAALFDYFKALRDMPPEQAFEKAFDLDLATFEVQAEGRM